MTSQLRARHPVLVPGIGSKFYDFCSNCCRVPLSRGVDRCVKQTQRKQTDLNPVYSASLNDTDGSAKCSLSYLDSENKHASEYLPFVAPSRQMGPKNRSCNPKLPLYSPSWRPSFRYHIILWATPGMHVNL